MSAFDFIIVGGGSAGCVLAERLSACGKYQVCLLEAGVKDTSKTIHMPIGVVSLMRSKKLNWQYNSVAEETQDGRKIFNPRGKTLGGSSSINAMLYVRGQKQDYDHWAELGNDQWSFDKVLPYFKSTQYQERGESELHGVKGELNVADTRGKAPIFDDFISAAQEAGFKANDDFNGQDQEGVGYYQVTQKGGLRYSAAKAFLTPNLDRPNLTVLTQVQVSKILVENGCAKGVSYQQNGEAKQLFANKEVLLSAGAFNSPQLLMLSGIGPKEELEKHQIKVEHDLPGVGKNLQEHVDVMVVKNHKRTDLLSLRPKGIWWAIKDSLKFFRNQTGVLTTAVAEAGGFVKSTPELSRPDLQLHFIPGAMDDHGRNTKLLMKYGISLHVCLLRPKSTGCVTLQNAHFESEPNIQLNMLAEKEDQDIMIKGVKLARKIMSSSPLEQNNGEEIFPGEACQSDDQILDFIKQKSNTIYHPVGTCKMGSDEMAVVDQSLKVHGINNLRVIDASVMPTLISGNTNAPTIMIAAKTADNILAAHS